MARARRGDDASRYAALRLLFRGLSVMAPPAVPAALAATLFRTPPRHRHSTDEREALATGQRLTLSLEGRPLAVWRWGHGPLVLFVHGWGSRGARLAPFLGPLHAAGFSVAAFDAPGHGDSAGRLSSLPQFIRAIQTIARELGPVEAIVAHSMGGAAATLAMSWGVAAKRAVFIAPASDPAGYSELFAQALGLAPAVLAGMKARLERRFAITWDRFDVISAARAMTAPLLVFHDRDDREVGWGNGEAIAAAWPGAELVSTEGLGHRRIVADPAVVARAVAFLRMGTDLFSATTRQISDTASAIGSRK